MDYSFITYLNLIVGPPTLHGACTCQVPFKFLKNSGSPLDRSQRMAEKETESPELTEILSPL